MKGTAFYLNAQALGNDVHAKIMQYHWQKKAHVTRETSAVSEKQSLMTSFKSGAGKMIGNVHSTVSSPGTTGYYFQEILADCTRKGMARLGFYCDVHGVYASGKDDQVFAVVYVTNLRVDKYKAQGCCHLGKCTLPAALFQMFVCCPRTSFHECCCANCVCQGPLNVDAVADHVECVFGDSDSPVSIPVRIDGQVASTEHLYLERRGFKDVDLPDAGSADENNAVRTISSVHH
jgi:hypothetical protein